jgi:hypothetical protein
VLLQSAYGFVAFHNTNIANWSLRCHDFRLTVVAVDPSSKPITGATAVLVDELAAGAFQRQRSAASLANVTGISPSTTSTRRIVATPFGIDLPFIQYDAIHIVGRLAAGDARIIMGGTKSNPKTYGQPNRPAWHSGDEAALLRLWREKRGAFQALIGQTRKMLQYFK